MKVLEYNETMSLVQIKSGNIKLKRRTTTKW